MVIVVLKLSFSYKNSANPLFRYAVQRDTTSKKKIKVFEHVYVYIIFRLRSGKKLLETRIWEHQQSIGHDHNSPLSGYLRPWIYLAESVEQDQPAHTCSLILLCTLHCSITSFGQRNTQCHANEIC